MPPHLYCKTPKKKKKHSDLETLLSSSQYESRVSECPTMMKSAEIDSEVAKCKCAHLRECKEKSLGDGRCVGGRERRTKEAQKRRAAREDLIGRVGGSGGEGRGGAGGVCWCWAQRKELPLKSSAEIFQELGPGFRLASNGARAESRPGVIKR